MQTGAEVELGSKSGVCHLIIPWKSLCPGSSGHTGYGFLSHPTPSTNAPCGCGLEQKCFDGSAVSHFVKEQPKSKFNLIRSERANPLRALTSMK